ncbi:conserved exported hypothetical protein [Vibrio chagasii]|nr:conserved exported hypothetical protein [Vibrio chagasii]
MKRYTAILASLVAANSIQVSALESQTKIDQHMNGAHSLYEDKVDVTYLEKVIVIPSRNWVGSKIMQKGDVCFEVKQEVKLSKKSGIFDNLEGAAALPSEVDIGKLEQSMSVVDCSRYILSPVTVSYSSK